jgi:hypothetical protein
MMATAHTLVAGAIAANFGSPILAPILALGSHFLLDSIPHWDFGTDWKKRTKRATGVFAIIDTVIGFSLSYILFHTRVPSLILIPCLILSVLPDWLEAPWYIFFANPKHHGLKPHAQPIEKIFYGFYTLTNRFHSKAPFPWGLISQIVVVTLFLLVLQ